MSGYELAELSEAVELQRKSYGLLLWMAERIRQDTFVFHRTRHYGTAMEAARECSVLMLLRFRPACGPTSTPNG